MRRYLAELHTKPDHHKRRFALFASSTITLFIFGVWSLATFGVNDKIIARNNVSVPSTRVESNEISPFQSLRLSLAASLEAIRGSFRELKTGLEAINIETEYRELRDGALNIYGQ